MQAGETRGEQGNPGKSQIKRPKLDIGAGSVFKRQVPDRMEWW